MGRAGEAIPKLTAELTKMGKAAGDTRDQLAELKVEAKAAEDAFGDLSRRLNQAQDDAGAFAVAFHSILDIQEAINAGYRERAEFKGNAGANSDQYNTTVATGIQSLITKLRRIFGSNNAMAAMAQNVLTELQGRIITPDEAIRTLQGLFSGLEGGIIRDIGQGATPEIRALAAAIERFIHGGNLQGF